LYILIFMFLDISITTSLLNYLLEVLNSENE
jgi:hypothetical protein